MHTAHNCLGEHIGCQCAQQAYVCLLRAMRKRKDDVAIDSGVYGVDRACQAIVCHLRHLGTPTFGKRGVGCHDRQRCIPSAETNIREIAPQGLLD